MCCRVYFYACLWSVDTGSSLRFRTVQWLLALCSKSILKSRIYLPLFLIPSSFSLSTDALFVAQSSRIEFEANEGRKVETVKVGIKYARSKKRKEKKQKKVANRLRRARFRVKVAVQKICKEFVERQPLAVSSRVTGGFIINAHRLANYGPSTYGGQRMRRNCISYDASYGTRPWV